MILLNFLPTSKELMFYNYKVTDKDVFPIDKLFLIFSFGAFYLTTRIVGVQNTEKSKKKGSPDMEPNFFKKNAFDDDYMDEHNDTFYNAEDEANGLEEAL